LGDQLILAEIEGLLDIGYMGKTLRALYPLFVN